MLGRDWVAQLLMLSGVGPALHLEEYDISVVDDMPGVGQYMRDHPSADMEWTTEADFATEDRCEKGTPSVQAMLCYTASSSDFSNDS